MELCRTCGKPIAGSAVTKVTDGWMSEDGEFDPTNTESYHSSCLVVDW